MLCMQCTYRQSEKSIFSVVFLTEELAMGNACMCFVHTLESIHVYYDRVYTYSVKLEAGCCRRCVDY